MDLEPADPRALLEELAEVRGAQTDADDLRPGAAVARHGARPRLPGLFQLAAGLGAGALGDEFPLRRALVGLGLARAAMRTVGRGAIVLAGLGDPEALFLLDLGLVGGGRGAGCKRRRGLRR
jgi:hypothetical protein